MEAPDDISEEKQAYYEGKADMYDEIIGLLPQEFRQNTTGAQDGVARLVKAYEEVTQECHEWRHGHRQVATK